MFSFACICTKCSCKTRKRYENYLYFKIATYLKIVRNNSIQIGLFSNCIVIAASQDML